MKNLFYTIFAIGLCLALGKLINYFLPVLPASLYGMVIYCFCLQLNWLSPEKVNKSNQWFIKNMGVCFVPAGVGIINHFQLIQQYGVELIGIIFFSSFILLTLVGLLGDRMIKSIEKNNVV